jgi:hypothetical protein
MDKRSFGKPPNSSTGSTSPRELKSELFTKIGTRAAVITAHYEHIQPVNSGVNALKVKQVTFAESQSEAVYDVPNHNSVTKL